MSYVRNVIRSPPRTLSVDEAERLLEVTGQHVDGFRDHVIFQLALSTALREHEIAGLDVGDVVRPLERAQAARGPRRPGRAARGPRRPGRAARGPAAAIRTRVQLRVFKRSSHAGAPADPEDQQVFLPRLVRLKLEKFIEWKRKHKEDVRPGAPLFLSRFRRRLSTRQLRTLNRVWQQRAGFDRVHPFHRLRHTMLSQLYGSTGDLLLVQRAARHASTRSTEIYTHVSDERLQDAVEKNWRR